MKKLLLGIALILSFLFSCSESETEEYPERIPQEKPVTVIPLSNPLGEDWTEISGLDWHGDQLIFLPQYPGRFDSDEDGSLFRMSKSDIIAYLESQDTDKSAPEYFPVTLIAPGLAEKIDGYQGFEAIAFDADTVFLSIEASARDMAGYIIRGIIDSDNRQITLDTSRIVSIPMQVQLDNTAFETLLLIPGKIIAIYEANGKNVNPNAKAAVFDRRLNFLETIPFPVIEYRVTDATKSSSDSTFWVSNYFWSPDESLYRPAEDPLFKTYGKGATHRRYKHVERLVCLKYENSKIDYAPGVEPIQIELIGDNYQRNWEGIVHLDDKGFLVVTDKFPETIFGFIPNPAAQ